MQDRLSVLQRYFSIGSAESEFGIPGVYLPPSQFEDVLAAPSGNPRFLVGPKGIGKTALLEHVKRITSEHHIPAIKITPSDIDLTGIHDLGSTAEYRRALLNSLSCAVAEHIGSHLQGLLTGDAAELYMQAVKSGLKNADRISKLSALLRAVAKPAASIDLDAFSNALGLIDSTQANVRRIRGAMESQGSVAYCLLDDTDQIADLMDPSHLNRIWGILLAARDLATQVHSLRIIVTLRSDVWQRLTQGNRGQRDQVDHIRPLIVELRAKDDFIKSIFEHRLKLAARDAGTQGAPLLHFFADSEVVLPQTDDDTRDWATFLAKSARERPRDMIQLMSHIIRVALSRGTDVKITSKDAEIATYAYSQERIYDVGVEFAGDCSEFDSVVKDLAYADFASGFRIEFEALRDFLRRLPGRHSISVRGKQLSADTDDAAFSLLELLHNAGVLNPRIQDTRKPRGFRHIVAADGTGFVQKTRWNEMQKATWELHPAFRSAIKKLQSDLAAQKTR